MIDDTTRKPNVKPLIPALHSTLSSSRPDDDISEDIAELVGFDAIELVMEILDNRALIVQEVSRMVVIFCFCTLPTRDHAAFRIYFG